MGESRDPMTEARAEATQELCSELLKTAGAVMTRHGNDPHGIPITVAGFVMAIRAADEIFPSFSSMVASMLNGPKVNHG